MHLQIRSILGLAVATGLLIAAGAAMATPINLVSNGDFEAVDDRIGLRGFALDSLSSNRWDVYDEIPDWYSHPSEAGIEVQYWGTVVAPQSGHHYIELDSHFNRGFTNSSMSQDLDLDTGDYLLEFYYRPRTNTPGDNGITVLFGGSEVALADGISSRANAWEYFARTVTVTDASLPTALTFTAIGNDNTLGGFIDTVSLTAKTPVPEPSSAILFGAGGLLAAFAIRKRTRI